MSLSKTLYPLPRTGSIQKYRNLSGHEQSDQCLPSHLYFLHTLSGIGPVKNFFEHYIVIIYLPISYDMFWVLKRNVLLRQFS